MNLYKTETGIVVQHDGSFYLLKDKNWDTFFNDDRLAGKIADAIRGMDPVADSASLLKGVQAPIQQQEVWASGVTYYRSKVGRQEESKDSGAADFYAKVYEAERPELFFKATALRTVAHGQKVRIRRDSTWNVPEPELTLAITSSGKIVGYTIGNDMSSRSIEGENPLYLPQAKTYDGSAALGPCIYVTDTPLDGNTLIRLEIKRGSSVVFKDEVAIKQIRRRFTDLVSFLYRECSFPHGSFLMTGTGIVPSQDFTLQAGDHISITIDPIGTLVNSVA